MGTPPPIRGNWRGLEIQGGYVTGEWLVVFKENTVLITHVADAQQSPEHRLPWEATVSLWGGRNADITLTPTAGKDKGKAIYCIYSLQTGKRLSKMTLAMAKPGSETAPGSYDLALGDSMAVEYCFCCAARTRTTHRLPATSHHQRVRAMEGGPSRSSLLLCLVGEVHSAIKA